MFLIGDFLISKEFDWIGDVATRVDCVPQKLNSLRNIYPKGMSEPGKILRPGR